MFAWLRRLDDRALNSWWGLVVTPFAWLNYRAGYHSGDTDVPLGGWLRGPQGTIFARGAREGRPLGSKRRDHEPS